MSQKIEVVVKKRARNFSDEDILEDELYNITNLLKNNGYPNSFTN